MIIQRSVDQLEGELGLGRELNIVGDTGFRPTVGVVHPGFRQIQCKVDEHLPGARSDRQARADLAVSDLASRPRVLPPGLRRSAGARFTVTRLCGTLCPTVLSALLIRTAPSFTDGAASPTT